MAAAPNQLWSWDITKLLGPRKWTYFYLYVILDVFRPLRHRLDGRLSRSAEFGQATDRGELPETRHSNRASSRCTADRGTSMSSKPVAFLLADLGVTKTHSRPHVSNDNPYSESQFRTMKYRPEFSGPFRVPSGQPVPFARDFFVGTTKKHRHSRPGLAHADDGALWSSRKRAAATSNRARCLLINFTRNASYEALPSHRLFPAQSGLTSRFPLRNRCCGKWQMKQQKRGCCGSTESAIVAARRSWREISCEKLAP